jgi:arylsulfatase A-like enzyme
VTTFSVRFLVIAGGLFIACAARAQPAPAPAAPRPNIIFILADDLGYGDVGGYGATRVKTPNIDKLAQQGFRFTDVYAPLATCTPSRSAFTPSRSALLIGEYTFRKKAPVFCLAMPA